MLIIEDVRDVDWIMNKPLNKWHKQKDDVSVLTPEDRYLEG